MLFKNDVSYYLFVPSQINTRKVPIYSHDPLELTSCLGRTHDLVLHKLGQQNPPEEEHS